MSDDSDDITITHDTSGPGDTIVKGVHRDGRTAYCLASRLSKDALAGAEGYVREQLGKAPPDDLIAEGRKHDAAMTAPTWLALAPMRITRPCDVAGIVWLRNQLGALLDLIESLDSEVRQLLTLASALKFDTDERERLTAERDESRAENERLKTRQQELLHTIVRITNETPFPDEIKGWTEQRAKLVAEIGTLRAQLKLEDR